MNRRDLLAASISMAATLPALRQAWAQPCPPPTFGVEGGTIAGTACGPAVLPLGTLSQDAKTPEQIPLYLPITGTVSHDAAALVRYRSGSGSWKAAHPLLRIRPEFVTGGAPEAPVDAFAGTIFDLSAGRTYEVEVTVTDPAQGTDVITQSFSTRTLPPPAGSATATATPSDNLQAKVDALSPGDVLELAAGTYTLADDLVFNNVGAAGQAPIYIHGVDRSSVVIEKNGGRILDFREAHEIVLEDLTLRGEGVDNGTALSQASIGARFAGDVEQSNITIRRVTIDGVDRGFMVGQHHGMSGFLAYDCILNGTNVWNQDLWSGSTRTPDGTPDLQQNTFWNDEGCRIAGVGNCVWNCTFDGFGDTCSVEDGVFSAAVYWYRNKITNSGDDACEGDYGTRNLGFYDNHVTNCRNLLSLDPLWGGPFYCFRNVAINTLKGPFKLNDSNSGQLIYSNTMIRTDGYPDTDIGFLQHNNGGQRNWAYRNNVLLFLGAAPTHALFFSPTAVDPVDWSHNAWYPNAKFTFSGISGGDGDTLAQAQANMGSTAPTFPPAANLGAPTRPLTDDFISERDPFVSELVLDNFLIPAGKTFTPTLGGDSELKGAGVAIPGITDGYTGSAPDVGAIIQGQQLPTWGAR